jgi:hypothetical protein
MSFPSNPTTLGDVWTLAAIWPISRSLSLTLLPTVSRPVCLGTKHASGASDQSVIAVRQLRLLLIWHALSEERTGLLFTIAAGPRQCSHSRVRVPWYLWCYITFSDSRLPFLSPPTTRRATVGLKTRPLFLSDSCRLVDMRRSLWREDGSVVCQT